MQPKATGLLHDAHKNQTRMLKKLLQNKKKRALGAMF
jgi:hypothetical protein